jgi:hypothetical protein
MTLISSLDKHFHLHDWNQFECKPKAQLTKSYTRKCVMPQSKSKMKRPGSQRSCFIKEIKNHFKFSFSNSLCSFLVCYCYRWSLNNLFCTSTEQQSKQFHFALSDFERERNLSEVNLTVFFLFLFNRLCIWNVCAWSYVCILERKNLWKRKTMRVTFS